MQQYTYLILDAAVISIPFIASFFSKHKFYKEWRHVFPAIGLTGLFFIIWDIFFTIEGIWGFNPEYLTGIEILHLPIEEWLFFLVVPYACTFTFYAFRVLMGNDPAGRFARNISLFLFALTVSLTITHFGQHYTFFTSLFTAILIGLHLWKWNSSFLGWFYITYLVIMVPFVISNGILTGIEFWEYPVLNLNPADVNDQVVWYNNDHNIGIRLFSIPIDDTIYSLLLQLMTVTWYEYFRSRYSEGNSRVAVTA